MKAKKLNTSFFARPADRVAYELIGKILVWRNAQSEYQLRIVETEAYLGIKDKACHAAKGRTKRMETMFGPPGLTYVYLCYGMYHMLNFVCEKKGDPHAVLIRAAESLSHPALKLNGPGKICRELKITRDHNALSKSSGIFEWHQGAPPQKILKSKRIGINYAGSWANRKLRYLDALSPAVSRPA